MLFLRVMISGMVLFWANATVAHQVSSVQDLIQLAFKHNISLQQHQIDNLINQSAYQLEKEAFHPKVDIQTHLSATHYQQLAIHKFDSNAGVTPTVTLKTPIGTEFYASSTVFLNKKPNQTSILHNQYRVGLVQPLLKGAATTVNRNLLNNAKYREQVGNLLYQQAKRDVVYALFTQLSGLQQAVLQKKAYEAILNRQRELVNIVTEKINAGRLPANDLKNIQLQLTQLEAGLLKIELAVESQKMELCQIVGVSDLQLNNILIMNKDNDVEFTDEADVIAKNLSHQILLLNKKHSEGGLLVAKDALKPDLNLRGEMNWQKNALSIDTPVFDLPGFPYHEHTHYDHSYLVQLNLNLPFGQRGYLKHALQQQNWNDKKLSLDIIKSENNIKSYYAMAVREANIQYKQLQLAKKQAQLASETFENKQLEYEAGRVSAYELVGQKDRWLQAKLDYIAAKRDYKLANIKIMYLNGDLERIWSQV